MTRLKNSTAFGKERTKKATPSAVKNTITIPEGSRKSPKRIGQGPGSGLGKTSARGSKGQRARAATMKRGFEGGQMPLHKRLPKRGFTSKFREEFQPVNLQILEKYKLSGKVDPQVLYSKNIIKNPEGKIKILGTGEISTSIDITADAFSESAKSKIEKAGGKTTLRNEKAE
jgi:large subunit ribosomal protein L15